MIRHNRSVSLLPLADVRERVAALLAESRSIADDTRAAVAGLRATTEALRVASGRSLPDPPPDPPAAGPPGAGDPEEAGTPVFPLPKARGRGRV